MALQPKTFRASEDIVRALKQKADELKISESDVINKALKCYLGIYMDENCDTYMSELKILENKLNTLVKINNLKEV
ncbi:hypothetical protein NIES4071_03000 [Calothrix sp. NIES-4071]|nr:hypothetical protein NIES4071_03000 [Calothrix sp. NIES-4071]BAZ54646.1 hypothetical protein NIES4105_02990 [Calothrix sp. NIES-4105]